MQVPLNELKENQKFIIWGAGNYLNETIDKIDPETNILFVCDRDGKKWGTEVTSRRLQCFAPDILNQYENIVVLIAVKDRQLIREISAVLNQQGISYCHINELVREYREKYEATQIQKYDQTLGQLREPGDWNVLKRFISVSVPVQACQLKCEYCYIGQKGGFENDDIVLPSAQFVRKALSRKRLGGTALINFCGAGETLLCKELFSIVQELLEEGHYISIITNALLTKEINRFLQLPLTLRKKLFFKCSFHYRQLKEKNLLEIYSDNVNNIWKSGASISVELVPEDELVPFISEIKEFSLEHFGALPHLTVGRDESKAEMPIITKYGEEEYRKIWGQFNSDMFSFKLNQMTKRNEYCTAGKNTFLFSLESGRIAPCPREKSFYNIYNDISSNIDYKEVGFACSNPYCRNGHAYLTLGIVEGANEGSYLQIRDRVTCDGKHWVVGDMADIFSQRICDNQKDSGVNSV